MDKLIRELLINVKQQGSAKTTKALQGIVDALEDAATGAELANEQLAKISPTLSTIAAQANKAASAMGNLGAMKNLDKMAKSLDTIEEYLDELLTTSTVASEKMVAGFTSVTQAVDRMGNTIAGTVERTEDQLIGLNSTVGKTKKGFDDTSGAAVKATRAIGDTSGASRGATRDFSAMAKIGGSLPIMYAAIASNVFVLQSAFEQLKMGDQLNRLEKFGTIVGSLTGTPVQTLAASLQEAVGYAISFQEAMRQASTASAYGFDSKQLEQFGLVARRAAAALGVDMTDALNRVIKGVSKQEIELLDELGVTIRLNDAYAAYVKQLNAANTGIQYNVNSLSTFQKQQAYANAVIAESTRRFSQLDSALRATPWEQFAANADSALRKLQQSAATVLEPIIQRINTIFYQTQAAQSAVEATAQLESNSKVDPANTSAVINSLTSSTEGYNAAVAKNTEAMQKQKVIQDQLNAAKKEYGALGNTIAGFASLTGITPSDGSKKIQILQDQLSMVTQEVDDSKASLDKWNQAVVKAGQTVQKAAPGISKALNLSFDQSGTTPGFNETVLKSLSEQTKAYEQQKKTAADTVSTIAGLTLNSQSAAKAAADLATNIQLVQNYSKSTGENMDTLTKNLNLGYGTMQEMVTAQKNLTNLSTLQTNESKNELDVQKKINDVYASTNDKEKAQAAGRALEVQQLDQKLAVLREAQKNGIADKAIQQEIYKLETQKLNVQNQGMETAKKVKDVSDKIVGIEDQIALSKDNTLNADQYALKTAELQLSIEQQRQKLLVGRADKERDYMQSKLQEAQIERAIRDLNFSQAEAASKREREQDIAMRNASGEMSTQEQIMNQINDLERERAELIKNSSDANVALDSTRVSDLLNQIDVLQKQLKTSQADKSRNFQNQGTGLLGGSYSSSFGQSGDTKAMTEFLNNQQGYAQAISNLQAINAEATAAGQSLGNMVNAMMQFSQGSLDSTSMVAAGMQTVSSAIQYSTTQQISAIDAAISAEQSRDGQSEESKAKIKKLEAEKIKVQQESAKKQILIQTAVAVMQAATSLPYPWSIPLMIAAAASGALAYSQASSATPQLDGMSGGSDTAASLSLGKRDNSVDVSKGGNAGELSYIHGDSGVGNANNFIPRAEGGNMIPGVGYITGENGIEVVTPSVPSKVTPASDLGSAGAGGSTVIMQVSAMDAKSFVDFANENSTAFRGAVEVALNENGMTLNNLNRR